MPFLVRTKHFSRHEKQKRVEVGLIPKCTFRKSAIEKKKEKDLAQQTDLKSVLLRYFTPVSAEFFVPIQNDIYRRIPGTIRCSSGRADRGSYWPTLESLITI